MEVFLHNLDWVLPLRSPAATEIANWFTWFGYLPFFLTFLSLGFWLDDRERFLRLAILLAVSAIVFSWLKDYWRDPRPDIIYSLDPRVGKSFGRPSGHSMTTVVLWGWLAYETRRSWMWALATFMIVAVSFSRLYLGVHDVDDVLTGTALGIATLFIFRWTLTPSFAFFRNWPLWAHLVVIGAVVALLRPLWPLPDGPPSYVSSDFFLLAGALIGLSFDRRLAPGPEATPFSLVRVGFSAIALYPLFELLNLLTALGPMLNANKAIWGLFSGMVLGLAITLAFPYAIRTLSEITERAMNRRVQ